MRALGWLCRASVIAASIAFTLAAKATPVPEAAPPVHVEPTHLPVSLPAHAQTETKPPPRLAPIRVTLPVRGLYEAIPVSSMPKGWHIEEGLSERPLDEEHAYYRYGWEGGNPERGRLVAAARVGHEGGGDASFARSYDVKNRIFSLERAFLDGSAQGKTPVPTWIEAPVPLVEGKGVPTVVYMTLRQMKQMRIPYGGLREIRVDDIVNGESLIDMQDLKARGLSVDEGVRQSATYKYLETIATQSGHKVVRMQVDMSYQNEAKQPDGRTVIAPKTYEGKWQGRWALPTTIRVYLAPATETVAPGRMSE